METKSISLELDAYERLRSAKRRPEESFSEVVRRLPIVGDNVTGREILDLRRHSGPMLSERDCVEIDALNALDGRW